jgi:hypothetical protein
MNLSLSHPYKNSDVSHASVAPVVTETGLWVRVTLRIANEGTLHAINSRFGRGATPLYQGGELRTQYSGFEIILGGFNVPRMISFIVHGDDSAT